VLSFVTLLDIVFASDTVEAVGTNTMFKVHMYFIEQVRHVIGKLSISLLQVLNAFLASAAILTSKFALSIIVTILADFKGATRSCEARWARTWFVSLFWALATVGTELPAIRVVVTSAKIGAGMLAKLSSIVMILCIGLRAVTNVFSGSVSQQNFEALGSVIAVFFSTSFGVFFTVFAIM
jgi:hypothetical protein